VLNSVDKTQATLEILILIYAGSYRITLSQSLELIRQCRYAAFFETYYENPIIVGANIENRAAGVKAAAPARIGSRGKADSILFASLWKAVAPQPRLAFPPSFGPSAPGSFSAGPAITLAAIAPRAAFLASSAQRRRSVRDEFLPLPRRSWPGGVRNASP
jgi:hypothetical protein